MQNQTITDSLQNSEPLRGKIPHAPTPNPSDEQNTFANYTRRFLTDRFPRGLSAAQILSFQNRVWELLRSNDIAVDAGDEVDAILETQAIGLELMCRLGNDWIPDDHMWMIYDPCMTSKWKDEDVASRFQDFLRKRQEEEQREARRMRHASANRRRELLEQHQGGSIGDLINKVATHFVAGLLKELHVAHRIPSAQPERGEDDWEVIDGADTRPLSLGGLFGKWCPTPGGMHDKALGIIPIIRKKLLESLRDERNRSLREDLLRLAGQRVGRDFVPLEHLSLQRDVLTPLRRQAEVPEHFIGASKGIGVNYNRMPSRCRMLFGTKVFRRLDQENYDKFLIDAAKSALLTKLQGGGAKTPKVNAGVLAPHEVTLRAVKAEASSSSVAKVEAALQWQALLDSCAQPADNKTGTKRLIIPMCDVSGSMCCPCGDGQNDATCMDVACALSLLLTESLPESNAYHGKILTFSDNPTFVDLKPEKSATLTIESIKDASSLEDLVGLTGDLAERVNKLKESDWGCSTNFFKAMERICDLATEHQLTSDEIGALELVVFSDMEFNQAQYGMDWDQKTMLEKIRQLFLDRFGPMVHPPKIVFWNLRASSSGSGVAGDANEEGVALLSGLSSGLLRKYLTWNLYSSKTNEFGEAKMNPTRAMIACLEDSLYETLQLENDLLEWEVLMSEEDIMKRAEKVPGENNELVHTSNSSALVAFFFEVVPGIEVNRLEELLTAAFEENPLIALKLVFNLGSVRKHAAGKADRFNFQAALLWLFRTWPKTYFLNIQCISQFSSLKELLNSVMFILYEGEVKRDPDNHALYSLAGQKEALDEHRQRQQTRDDKARRHKRKLHRLLLWSDFARSEERKLFGGLRVQVEWGGLKEKLCIEKGTRVYRSGRVLNLVVKNSSSIYEDSWERKERLTSEWEARMWKKRNARSRELSRNQSKKVRNSAGGKKGTKKRKAQLVKQRIGSANEDTWGVLLH